MEPIYQILTWVFGGTSLLGTFAGIAFYAQTKRTKEAEAKLKEAEARKAEVDIEKARIEGKADEFHIWKDQCEALSDHNKALIARNGELVKINAEKEDRHQQDIKDWEERFTNQTTYLSSVQRDLIAANERANKSEQEHIRREARLEKELAHYKMWKCYREDNGEEEGCARRKPKQPIPIKYIPLADDSLPCLRDPE